VRKKQETREDYKRAFSWGKKEHRLERWTNIALYITVILFIIVWYRHSWFLFYFAFTWLLISIGIHMVARWCHRKENKYHSKAHEKKGFWH